MVFSSEPQAIDGAVQMLVDVGEIERTADGLWRYEGATYGLPGDVLSDWQEHLGSTEYFHVLPVGQVERTLASSEAGRSCEQS